MISTMVMRGRLVSLRPSMMLGASAQNTYGITAAIVLRLTIML
jgi:hypothetical protein